MSLFPKIGAEPRATGRLAPSGPSELRHMASETGWVRMSVVALGVSAPWGSVEGCSVLRLETLFIKCPLHASHMEFSALCMMALRLFKPARTCISALLRLEA